MASSPPLYPGYMCREWNQLLHPFLSPSLCPFVHIVMRHIHELLLTVGTHTPAIEDRRSASERSLTSGLVCLQPLRTGE